MSRAYFVTGTDTGAGKTRVACALVHALRAQGHRVAAMKPVAAGAERTPAGWRNEDVEALLDAAEPGLERRWANPYCLPEPTAPEIAAAQAGVQVLHPPILQAFDHLAGHYDRVVVEGVGGWEAPLAADLLQADLCRARDLPVLLVVGLRLGCINHARLTLRAIREDGLRCLGWCGSAVDPDLTFREETVALLAQHLELPLLGILPHRPEATPASLAPLLDLGPLLDAAPRVSRSR